MSYGNANKKTLVVPHGTTSGAVTNSTSNGEKNVIYESVVPKGKHERVLVPNDEVVSRGGCGDRARIYSDVVQAFQAQEAALEEISDGEFEV